MRHTELDTGQEEFGVGQGAAHSKWQLPMSDGERKETEPSLLPTMVWGICTCLGKCPKLDFNAVQHPELFVPEWKS